MENGKEPGERTRRGPRLEADDAFGRILGEEWVAVEPGIYRLASDLDADAERSRRQGENTSLDESLLGAIPGREESPQPERPQQSEPAGRSWWRRK